MPKYSFFLPKQKRPKIKPAFWLGIVWFFHQGGARRHDHIILKVLCPLLAMDMDGVVVPGGDVAVGGCPQVFLDAVVVVDHLALADSARQVTLDGVHAAKPGRVLLGRHAVVHTQVPGQAASVGEGGGRQDHASIGAQPAVKPVDHKMSIHRNLTQISLVHICLTI